MTADDQQTAALALSEFRREVSVSLAEIRGDVRLMLQRGEHSERRVDDLARLITRLDERLDLVERDQVTRAQLDERDQAARAQMDERSRRTIAILALVITVVSILVGAGTAVAIALVNN